MEIIKKIFMSLREDIKTKMKLAKSIEILKQIDKTKNDNHNVKKEIIERDLSNITDKLIDTLLLQKENVKMELFKVKTIIYNIKNAGHLSNIDKEKEGVLKENNINTEYFNIILMIKKILVNQLKCILNQIEELQGFSRELKLSLQNSTGIDNNGNNRRKENNDNVEEPEVKNINYNNRNKKIELIIKNKNNHNNTNSNNININNNNNIDNIDNNEEENQNKVEIIKNNQSQEKMKNNNINNSIKKVNWHQNNSGKNNSSQKKQDSLYHMHATLKLLHNNNTMTNNNNDNNNNNNNNSKMNPHKNQKLIKIYKKEPQSGKTQKSVNGSDIPYSVPQKVAEIKINTKINPKCQENNTVVNQEKSNEEETVTSGIISYFKYYSK
ncbi:hypothetical protein H8356DRAFT_1308229 [Neocallimastix lanati (nom. inval.)]|nr:hypothetical protein H8356DRAFT_1308229 [Neocallimastix sp. JGI-2020a]